MIKKENIELYNLTPTKEERLWKDCIFIFDTSALLEFYYYSDHVRIEIFTNIFQKLVNRLWIPQQVEYEYLKNREKVTTKPIQSYKNLIKIDQNNKDSGHLEIIRKSIKNIHDLLEKNIKKNELATLCGKFNDLKDKTKKSEKHPYLGENLIDDFELVINEFEELFNEIGDKIREFENQFEEFENKVKKEISNREKHITELSKNDPVLEGFSKYFEVGEGYSFSDLMEIVKEGELRYRSDIPPGYEDGRGKRKKEGIQIYGDLIAWKQIISYAEKRGKSIVLIINDIKPDWCYKSDDKNNRIDSPREELVKELYDAAKVEFWMYTFSDFLYKANIMLDANLDKDILEKVEEVEKQNLIQKQHTNSNQKLVIFSEAPQANPINAQITVCSSEGLPVDHASITAIADNSTTKSVVTSSEGKAVIEIPTRRLYRLLVAHPQYPGVLINSWDPSDDLKVTLFESENTGSLICDSTCYVPSLEGRLNPILDTSGRTYLYADNIAINGGVQQPGNFIIDEPFELEDCNGILMQVRVLFIQGRISLIQYVYPHLNNS